MAQRLVNIGELDVIARCHAWQFFGSLTFGAAEPSEVAARKLAFAHIYRSARLVRVPFRRLLWILRVERGERLGRLHYHCLIGGAGDKFINLGSCFRLNALWSALPGCGFSRHRLYDRKQSGAEYVAACLGFEGSAGADFYETQKFGVFGADLMMARALLRYVGRGPGSCDRHEADFKTTAGKSRPSNAPAKGVLSLDAPIIPDVLRVETGAQGSSVRWSEVVPGIFESEIVGTVS